MTISIVGTSTPVASTTTTTTLNMPAGIQAGDGLFAFWFSRTSSATVTPPAGWDIIFNIHATLRRLYACWKVAQGGDAGPVFTTSGTDVAVGAVTAFRSSIDMQTVAPADLGTSYTGTATQNIGAIGRPTTGVGANGGVVFMGAKIDDWTSVDLLTGDGLTWTELLDYPSTSGNDCGLVVDVGLWTGGAPTLTNKTFTVTGGTAVDAAGKSFLIVERMIETAKRRVSEPVSRVLPARVCVPVGFK